MPAPPSASRGAMRPSTRSRGTFPVRATIRSPAISAQTAGSSHPTSCARAGSRYWDRASLRNWWRCAVPASPRAITCWRWSTPGSAAGGCMPVHGANGSAIRVGRLPPGRTKRRSAETACADVYLQNLFDMVRAKMAADPNQTIASSQEPRRADRPIAWSVDDSAELYQVNAWGKGYFSVNAAGHVVVRPDMNAEREIDLFEVVQGLKERELTTPVVVRFSDILAHRLNHLHGAFAQAIAE